VEISVPSRGNANEQRGSAFPSQGNTSERRGSSFPSWGNTNEQREGAFPSWGNTNERRGTAFPSWGNTSEQRGSVFPSQGNTSEQRGTAFPSRGRHVPFVVPSIAMRAFLTLLEEGRLYLPEGELSSIERRDLSALRATRVLQDEDPGMVDVSPPDLVRALRGLYGIRARGTPVPSTLDARPVFLGWIPAKDREVSVFLVAQPKRGLASALAQPGPSLVLVPTSSSLTQALRARHAPGAAVVVESLEGTLVARGGTLARKHGTPLPVAGAARPRGQPATTRLAGAARWEEITTSLYEPGVVRVDFGRRRIPCTPRDLGMVHPRSGKPTLVWEALEELCEGAGFFRTKRFGNEDATKKLVSRLRTQLHLLFGLEKSPFYRYQKGVGWRSRFTARPVPIGEGDKDWMIGLDAKVQKALRDVRAKKRR